MKTLWTFGDSFTNGYGYIDDGTYVYEDDSHKKYIKYKTESDDIWPNLLSKRLNCNLKNLSEGGFSNDKILDSIFDSISQFEKDDIVIISRTFNSRFDVPDINTSSYFKTIHGERLQLIKDKMEHMYDINDKFEQQTILNFGVLFMGNSLYKKRNDLRFQSFEQIIQKLVSKVIIWDVDSEFRKSFETIAHHTHHEINDYHFSYNAHRQIFEYFYNKLSGKKVLI